MERAGQAVFAAARIFAPEARCWLVACGAGNNGGDGYVIARLAAEAGMDVEVLALKDPDGLSGDAAIAAGAWQSAGGAMRAWSADLEPAAPDLVVDALLGTGLDREVGGDYAAAIRWINRLSCPRIAVDIPSGLNADTGRVMGVAVQAQLTVSLIGLKRGLFTADGPDCAGRVSFAGLEVPIQVYDAVENSGELIHEQIIKDRLKPRRRNAHKGDFGHVLIIGGIAGMSGAPRLAGAAALRSGAGLVSIATDPLHAHHMNTGLPELMAHACDSAQALEPLLERASVLAVGPGLGMRRWSRELLEACLESSLPAVLDADALNLLARQQAAQPAGGWILTPHPAEAARLLGTETQAVQSDRVGCALQIAERYGSVVVLKGCGTVVANPQGLYAICPLGNPGMATAGSGDVLTGVIAGLLAQGLDPWTAARTGVATHAVAGDHAAARLGERSLLAGDITDQLHTVLR